MNSSELTDEQLVVAVREHDKELYSEVIRRYRAKLTHYVRKFIHSPDELEDVLQVVFIKTYENLNGFDPTRKFSSWIYRITHNEALNYIKKGSKTNVTLEEVEAVLKDEKISIGDKVDAQLAKEVIEVGLGKLKKQYREVLILYFFEQKSYEEISDILRLPVSTVGTLLHRGKNQLRDYLKETAYGK